MSKSKSPSPSLPEPPSFADFFSGERDFDLFGNPVEPVRETRGRPRHRPNVKLRNKVKMLHDAGLNHIEIARVIGITAPTLRLNYFTELQSGSCTGACRAARDAGKEQRS